MCQVCTSVGVCTLSPFPKSGGQLAIGFYIHSFVANNIYNYLTIEKKGLEGLVG